MSTIEEISVSNYQEIARLACALWPDSTLETEEKFFNNCLEDKSQTVFLLKENSVSAGFLSLSLRQEYVEGTHGKPVCYVEGIYLDPAYRNKGYGRLLLEKAEIWGKQQHCSEIASDAEIENTASIEFHKSLGFREANRMVCFVKQIS